jgi:hypothetical protein
MDEGEKLIEIPSAFMEPEDSKTFSLKPAAGT